MPQHKYEIIVIANGILVLPSNYQQGHDLAWHEVRFFDDTDTLSRHLASKIVEKAMTDGS